VAIKIYQPLPVINVFFMNVSKKHYETENRLVHRNICMQVLNVLKG